MRWGEIFRAMPMLRHSGRDWQGLGQTPFGEVVWPIDEYLARRPHKPRVAARIRRLNPNGKAEGARPRGWNPHPRVRHFERGTIPVREFIRRHGRAAYDALPSEAIYRHGHRKGVLMRFERAA